MADQSAADGSIEDGSSSADGSSDALVDEISDSLADDGFGVFHGREFISIREKGTIAPNSTVTQQYLADKEAVILAYNENTNEIALIPLEQDYERTDVYSLQGAENHTKINASGFLKDNDIESGQTVRYSPEWNEDIGSDRVPGGLVIDLNQDGEVSPAANGGTAEEADDADT